MTAGYILCNDSKKQTLKDSVSLFGHAVRLNVVLCDLSFQMEVSDQFFGWLCGFGKRVKVISPVDVEEDFGKYVSKIRDMYEDVIT